MKGATRGWFVVLENLEGYRALMWAATLIPQGLDGTAWELAMANVEWMIAHPSDRLAKHWGMGHVYGARSWVERMEKALDQGPLDFPEAHFVRQVVRKVMRRRGLRIARILNEVRVGQEVTPSQVMTLFADGPDWGRKRAASLMRSVGVRMGHFEVVRPGSSIRGNPQEPVYRRVR